MGLLSIPDPPSPLGPQAQEKMGSQALACPDRIGYAAYKIGWLRKPRRGK